MKNHGDLLQLYEAVQDRMDEAVRRFDWEDRRAYSLWIRQTYEYVRNSTRILALTAGRLQQSEFSSRFIQHAAEEKGHDRLLINDAKHLGAPIDTLPAFAEAKAFHQSLYFSMMYDNPVAIFGWVIMLEGIAHRNGEKLFARAVKAHGEKCASFLKVHAAEDVEHIAKALEALSKLNEQDRQVVAEALKMYAELYCLTLNRIMEEAAGNTEKAADRLEHKKAA